MVLFIMYNKQVEMHFNNDNFIGTVMNTNSYYISANVLQKENMI